MTIGLHAAILATAFLATMAVGVASAGIGGGILIGKSDRLPLAAPGTALAYVTVEHRIDGVSILSRVAVGD